MTGKIVFQENKKIISNAVIETEKLLESAMYSGVINNNEKTLTCKFIKE